jgi:hypothetical protein
VATRAAKLWESFAASRREDEIDQESLDDDLPEPDDVQPEAPTNSPPTFLTSLTNRRRPLAPVRSPPPDDDVPDPIDIDSDDASMSGSVFMGEVVGPPPKDIAVQPQDADEISDPSDSSDHHATEDDRMNLISRRHPEPEPEPEPISDPNQFEEVADNDEDDGIDTSNLQEFFRQRRVVFEFLEDETDQLQQWDCRYSRVMLVKVVESQIDGINDPSYRIIVKSTDVMHVRQVGDRFVMGEPFHAFAFNDQVFLMAPTVSDKCS